MRCPALSIPAVYFKRQLHLPPFSHPTSSLTRPQTQLSYRSQLNPHSPDYIYDGLRYSAQLGLAQQGKALHAHVIKTGHTAQAMQNQLFSLYVKIQDLGYASKMFEEIPERKLISFNKLLCCVSRVRRKMDLGFVYFRRMLVEKVKPDHITYTALFRICDEMNDIVGVQIFHCRIVKVELSTDCFIIGALVDLYGKFGLVQDARDVFDCALRKDLVCWNIMISCYALNIMGKEAFEVFNMMQMNELSGDGFTVTGLLKACATLGSNELGRQVHGTLFKQGWGEDVVVASALIDMYAKNLCIADSRKVFDEMDLRNIISWTTIIVGHGRCADGKEAFKLLRQMLREGVVPDDLALASVVSSCGNMSMTGEISELHAYAMKVGYMTFMSTANSLISAYSKCGSIDFSLQCFSSIMVPDLVSWTSMIGAFAFHGFPDKAAELFEKMLLSGLKPDKLAFLQVLAACAHGGNVSKGIHYFTSMVKDYNLVPESEHYTCLVDLLGRAGLLNEAFEMLTSMPMEHGPHALGAFLGSCNLHGKVELTKWATKKLLTLEPNKPVNYTLMSNVHASVGGWSDAAIVRKTMQGKHSRKIPGCSWVEIAGNTHTPVLSEDSGTQAGKAQSVLEILHGQLIQEDADSCKTMPGLR